MNFTKMKIYIVDAFTSELFGGNPAAVCPLQDWISDELMQQIAKENNLSETAFFVPKGNDFALRWFTPVREVDLCGHATLASAHVLSRHSGYTEKEIRFHTRSGILTVNCHEEGYTLNLPTDKLTRINIPAGFADITGSEPLELYKGREDYLAVFNQQETIEQMQPDFRQMRNLDGRGLIVTSKGSESDFVSRCFYPAFGIDEDPVTGSAHCTLTAYWAEKLLKNTFTAIQLSARRGYLKCKYLGPRVEITGNGVTYLVGEIFEYMSDEQMNK